MAWIIKKPRQNPPISRLGSNGFSDGWNSLPNASALKDTELAELLNGIYSQYGSISKRQGTQIIGTRMSSATKILNQKMFYKIGTDEVDFFVRVNDLGKVESYNFATDAWSLLTGTPPAGYVGTHPTFSSNSPVFDTGAFINMVQYKIGGKNCIYFADPIDNIVIFDGVNWKVFTEITDPSTRPTVVKTGSGTGTRTFFYRYADLNEFGTTLASPANDGGQSTGQGFYDSMPEISSSTYLTLTLPAAATGTTRRAIYRGDVAGDEFFLDSIDADVNTYVDQKTDADQGTAFGVPADNDTLGYHFYLLDVHQGKLVGTTVEFGKEVLLSSAGLGAINLTSPDVQDIASSFSLADGADLDDYGSGDGQTINALKAFSVANSDGLAVFKDHHVGLVGVDSKGGMLIQNVNVIRGTMSPLSPHVAGDNIRFWSQEGVASLGHEANFGTILRYSVMSLKADSVVGQVTPANFGMICSDYINNLSLFGISTGPAGSGNNSILVFDERYNTWSNWTGLHPAVFSKAINPTTKIEEMYFGVSDAITAYGGNSVRMFTGKTDYASGTGSGNAITLSITTKQYDAKFPDKFKKYDRAVLVFGGLSGNGTTVQAIAMGENGIEQYPRYRISTDPVFSGFGNDEWGNQEIGMMKVDNQGETLLLRYINLRQKDLFWTKLNLQNDGIADEITLIGCYFYYTGSERELPSRSRLTTLA